MIVSGGNQTSDLDESRAVGEACVARRWTVREAITSSRPAAIAGATALVIAAFAAARSTTIPLACAVAIGATAPAVLVDVLDRRLPDRMVAGAAIIGAAAAGLTTVVGGRVDIVGAFVGAGLMAAPILLAHLVSPSSMGFGDVKLAVVLGAALGLVAPTLPILALFVGCALTVVAGLTLRVRALAFGPGLAAGAVTALALTAWAPHLTNDITGSGSATDPITTSMQQHARELPAVHGGTA